jgi:RiboL-PSP-HEPN
MDRFNLGSKWMSKASEDFELGIADAEDLLGCFDLLNSGEGRAPEALKRAALVMALTAWETYVEDRVKEHLSRSLLLLKDSHVGDYIFKKFDETIKGFHTPSGRKTQKLFLDFTGVDVTKNWVWNNVVDHHEVCKKLDSWIKVRGEAVHRSALDKQGGHLVARKEMDKCINFLRELVRATELSLVV